MVPPLCDKIIDVSYSCNNFTMFSLIVLRNLLDFGKCCFNNIRNVLPIFVLALREKGGLYQINFCLRYFLLLLWLLGFCLWLLGFLFFFNASEYISVAFSKISLLDDRSNSFLLINLSNSLKIVFR